MDKERERERRERDGRRLIHRDEKRDGQRERERERNVATRHGGIWFRQTFMGD